MPKVCKDRPRYTRPTFGFVGSSANKGCDAGKMWCTGLATQFLKNKKSTSVVQTDAALADAESAAGEYAAEEAVAFDITSLVGMQGC